MDKLDFQVKRQRKKKRQNFTKNKIRKIKFYVTNTQGDKQKTKERKRYINDRQKRKQEIYFHPKKVSKKKKKIQSKIFLFIFHCYNEKGHIQ